MRINFNYKKLSFLLYVISLITPSFFGSWIFGVQALILGWLGLFFGIVFIAIPWIANILYFGNLIFYKINVNIKICISVLTIVAGLFVIGLREIPENEGGMNSKVIIGIGFMFWILSFIILLIGQLKEKKLIKKKTEIQSYHNNLTN